MAKIANKYCSKIYITDDNPRNEDPKIIRKTLLKYISPESIFSSWLIHRKSVDFPEPDEPIIVIICPVFADKSTPFRTLSSPYDLCIFLSSSVVDCSIMCPLY